MAEYINRDATIKAIHDVYEYGFPTASGAFDDFATKIVPSLLNSIPAADVAPAVHGRWLHSGYVDHLEVVKCSECNHEAFAIALYVCDGNYCPECGAKMDGGADNG